ncbi:MAG: alpha/beta hydrolase [Pseudomonadota bacterium]|uniref:RBBP9/YdeN family alpha/beta hydrolase n=1 Tax=Acidovorax sp. JMULE5 TaxID=2518343 RepID=UPI0015A3E192|nr:alpha/beta hydrolase [Acidovorax sp. JMULE5]QLA79261.1 alpha/beta hydrolase [Acidovorax sp. JMULE5]
MTTRPVLLIPGIYNSGPTHWQSLWQTRHAGVARVEQADWDHPDCDTWVRTLDDAIDASPQPPILVAHSLGCLVAVHWAARHHRPVHALLLVAVPDPGGPNFPADAKGFAPLPAVLPAQPDLPRRVLMSSTSDPYSTPNFSAQCASAWNAEHVVLGERGHLNADSGLGDWPQGWELVARWRGE